MYKRQKNNPTQVDMSLKSTNYRKWNVVARLVHNLAYYDSAVQRFNHYTPTIV